MTWLLHLMASPRGAQSASAEVATTYIQALVEADSSIEVDLLNVWDEDLPEFGLDEINAKYAGIYGAPLTERQRNAWDTLAPLVERIVRADELVISVPMWNFGIHYRLKHFIDLVSQKDYLFGFDEAGFSGLASARALLICSRGLNFATGTDTPEAAFDHQKSYMLMWLKFIGITDVRTVTLEQLVFGSEADAASRAAARHAVLALARAVADVIEDAAHNVK